MSQEILRQIIDSYPIVTDELLASSHVMKTVSDASKFPQSPRIMRLYTDGSCLLSEEDKKNLENQGKRSSFSGWGYSLKRIAGAEPEHVEANHGHVFNGSTLLAELTAIREGLRSIDKPSVVSVVTDSRAAIQLLLNKDQTQQEYEHLDRSNKLGILRARELKAALDASAMFREKNIIHAEISWVKSHMIDNIPASDLPRLDEVQDGSERITLMDIYGNKEADKRAKKGANAAIKEALNFLRTQESGFEKEFAEVDKISADPMLSKNQKLKTVKTLVPRSDRGKKWRDMLNAVEQTSENLKAHGGARSEAMRVVANLPKNSLSNWTMSQLFTAQELQQITTLRNRGEEGRKFTDYGKRLEETPDYLGLTGTNQRGQDPRNDDRKDRSHQFDQNCMN